VIIENGSPQASRVLLLAHGAGAGMDSPFMEQVVGLLAGEAIRVIRFNFPYMEKSAQDGRRRPPDRQPVLERCFHEQVKRYGGSRLFIGGKSMGGRIATHVALQAEVAGVIALGFPFHPPGKPERFRGEHLKALHCPALVLQGERDSFGNRAYLEPLALGEQVELQFLPDGDHSFKPRKASGLTEADNLALAVERMREFVLSHE